MWRRVWCTTASPEFETSIGYYYQKGDLGAADGSGVQGRVAYNIGSGFSIGTNLSYDDAFDGRVSADILYRGATPEAVKAPIKKAWNAPTIKGLTDAVDNRGVRVHDGAGYKQCLARCASVYSGACPPQGIENCSVDFLDQ